MLSIRNEYMRAAEIEEEAQNFAQWLKDNVYDACNCYGDSLQLELRERIADLEEALLPLEEDPAQIPDYMRRRAYDNEGR